MSKKYKCKDIIKLWEEGWVCIPTAPKNPHNHFPSEIGRYIVNRFSGLEKNYSRICEAELGPYAIFRLTFNRNNPENKWLAYHDLRDPLSPDDKGLILLPDSALNFETKDSEETDWEIIEKSLDFIKENRKIIPNSIFIPPLGAGKDRLEEEDAVDDLMANLINLEDVFVIYGIEIPEEEINEKTEENENQSQSEENQENSSQKDESLIQDEFETIKINV